MPDETKRRLAAIVMADVVGYSRLIGADETGTLSAMSAHRQELWDPTIEQYGGRVVNRAGDSALVEFASAVAAMECAVTIQIAMLERNARTPEDKHIALRIGVNIGEVVVDGENIYGDGVNIAARLQTLAEPNGIALSGTVHENIANRLHLTLSDDGEQTVALYQRGLAAYYEATAESLKRSVQFLDQAIELDPSFAQAIAMSAEARCRASRQDMTADPEKLIAEARERSRRAISLEPGDPLCLAVQGHVLSSVGDQDLALSNLKRAVTLNPNDTMIRHWLARALTASGRPDEAIPEHDLVIRLSPNDPYSASFHIMRCMALLLCNRYDEAFHAAGQAIESPNCPYWAYAFLAAAQSKLGLKSEADAAIHETLKRAPDMSLKKISNLPYIPRDLVSMLREAGLPEG